MPDACPLHPRAKVVTFCPACRGAKGGSAKTEKQTEARKNLGKYPREKKA